MSCKLKHMQSIMLKYKKRFFWMKYREFIERLMLEAGKPGRWQMQQSNKCYSHERNKQWN